MRRFALGWKQRGLERKLQAKIVSYADDYVICCKGSAEEALFEMRWMMERLKLTINEAKTHVRHLPEERFDFLGYNFGRCYSQTTGRPFIGTRPSKKSLSRVIGKIRDFTASNTTWQEVETVVSQINRLTAGRANYVSLGPVTAPVRFDERGVETELRPGYLGTARGKGRQQTNRTYRHRATLLLY